MTFRKFHVEFPGYDPLEFFKASMKQGEVKVLKSKSHFRHIRQCDEITKDAKVTIIVREDEIRRVLKVSKQKLCDNSPYFRTMLNGPFIEATTQTVNLEAETGLISAKGIEYLIEIINGSTKLDLEDVPYTNRDAQPWLDETYGVVTGTKEQAQIDLIIEIARAAEMFQLTSLIKDIIAAQLVIVIMKGSKVPYPLDPDISKKCVSRDCRNMIHFTKDHIINTFTLVEPANPIRRVLYTACTRAFLMSIDDSTRFKFRFQHLFKRVPDFAYVMTLQIPNLRLLTPKVQGTLDMEGQDPFDGTLFNRKDLGADTNPAFSHEFAIKDILDDLHARRGMWYEREEIVPFFLNAEELVIWEKNLALRRSCSRSNDDKSTDNTFFWKQAIKESQEIALNFLETAGVVEDNEELVWGVPYPDFFEHVCWDEHSEDESWDGAFADWESTSFGSINW